MENIYLTQKEVRNLKEGDFIKAVFDDGFEQIQTVEEINENWLFTVEGKKSLEYLKSDAADDEDINEQRIDEKYTLNDDHCFSLVYSFGWVKYQKID